MALTLYWHPRCNSCRKTKKWLEEHEYEFDLVHIAENPPSKEILLDVYKKSGLELKKFISKSAKRYRDPDVREKIKSFTTPEDLFAFLATDGTLIKRPIVTDGKKATVGFDEETLTSVWGN